MKKQYIFLTIITIILYILYLIISFTYKEYKINSHIDYISNLNQNLKEKIKEAKKIIEYKNSLAYRNKVLKEQQSFKNKGETVIYLTSEKKYNTYTIQIPDINENQEVIKNSKIDNMTIYQKWLYFIFKKDSY